MQGCEATCQSTKSRRDDNCYDADPGDGLPVQCIGEWAEEKKHLILRNFIEATCEARAKYLPPRGPGGAAYIDLFAGPGRARVRSTGAIVDGSPLIAVKHAAAPFTKVILCDLSDANIAALRQRTRGDSRVETVPGDSNKNIDRIVSMVPQFGLNLALVDPYGVAALDFESIKRLVLASKRMDLLIHFPTGDMKRNIANAKATDWKASSKISSRWRRRKPKWFLTCPRSEALEKRQPRPRSGESQQRGRLQHQQETYPPMVHLKAHAVAEAM